MFSISDTICRKLSLFLITSSGFRSSNGSVSRGFESGGLGAGLRWASSSVLGRAFSF